MSPHAAEALLLPAALSALLSLGAKPWAGLFGQRPLLDILKLPGHALVTLSDHAHRASVIVITHTFGSRTDRIGQIMKAPNSIVPVCCLDDHGRLLLKGDYGKRPPGSYVPV
jgi:hypothetical protein